MFIVVGCIFKGAPSITRLAVVVVGPAAFLPWAFLCLASWFEPNHGTMSPTAKLMKWFPATVQLATRWYAWLFLVAFAMFAAIAWPAFAIWGL